MGVLEIIFWIGLFIVFYTYIGYGMLLYALVKLKECFRKQPPPPPTDDSLPDLTLFIAAYNEEDVVDEKMRNSLALDYPADKLHILWVTDGSNDRTNERLSHWPQATVLYQPPTGGKNRRAEPGIRFVTTRLLVFTDANTHLNREALREIVHAFATPKWAAWPEKSASPYRTKPTLHPVAEASTGNTNPPSRNSMPASTPQ